MLRGPYRAGPWPGLTPSGAGVLLGCALVLGLGEVLVGLPRRPVPDVPAFAVVALLPISLAARVVNAPGAATAVCGAYLLPRSLASLLQPSLELPPLLLIPTLAFELALWLRTTDIPQLWLSRRSPRRRHTPRASRTPTAARATIAGALFGLVLAIVQPPFAIYLGTDAAIWSGTDVWLATATASVSCAILGFAVISVPGTAS